MASKPMPALCPLCVRDDLTTEQTTDDGRRFVVCSAKEHGGDGYVWEPTPPPAKTMRGDGLGAELDIWDKLLECVPADGKEHPYGAVEDRLFERYSGETAMLQERYGHRWREGNKSANQFSMSVYLAARLSELAGEGLLVKTYGPAEGPWVYNGIISHWQRA